MRLIIFNKLNMFKSKYQPFKAWLFSSFYNNRKITSTDGILFESSQGKDIKGSVFSLLIDAVEIYRNINKVMYLSYIKSQEESIKNKLKYYNIYDSVKMVEKNTYAYVKALNSSELLINDTSFPSYFVKRENQYYLNIWHGIPIKLMGRSNRADPHGLGNVQRNFKMADFLFFPNEEMMKLMLEEYMLDEAEVAKCIIDNYPQIKLLLNKDRVEVILKELGIVNKRVLVYLPTWRDGNDVFSIVSVLKNISNILETNELLFYKLHPLMAREDLSDLYSLDNLREIPENFELYDFLSISDVLISDYSSVVFDYNFSNKKIILFQPDRKTYLARRGVYKHAQELAFEIVENYDNLRCMLNQKKQIVFSKKESNFFEFESLLNLISNPSVKNIQYKSRHSIKEKNDKKGNNKTSILIFGGNLSKNGITAALNNLIHSIDLNYYEITLIFKDTNVEPHKRYLLELDKRIKYIPINGKPALKIKDAFLLLLFFKFNIKLNILDCALDSFYHREINRLAIGNNFDCIIHFSGYERFSINMLGRVNSKKKIIYTHSDLLNEVKFRKNVHLPTMRYAYRNYDNVAVVSNHLKEVTLKFATNLKVNLGNKICVTENFHHHNRILSKSLEPIIFGKSTICVQFVNGECNKLNAVSLTDKLNTPCLNKFVTVGRFSIEKGHERLIAAFKEISDINENCLLLIIGGHGELFNETCKIIAKSNIRGEVILVKSLSNPYPLMKLCDLFVFSSYYEGKGLVLFEAASLALPIITTNIEGPVEFINMVGGKIVENSMNGLKAGMDEYLKQGISSPKINWEDYNKTCMNQFKDILF